MTRFVSHERISGNGFVRKICFPLTELWKRGGNLCGFEYASGVFTVLDAVLQDPPHLLITDNEGDIKWV